VAGGMTQLTVDAVVAAGLEGNEVHPEGTS
jgi:hypothetical protein